MRRQIRYAVLMDAIVLADERTIPAIVIDLSLGGAAIETSHPVPAELQRFTLFIIEPDFELRVECEARAIRELWTKRVLHAQFIGEDNHEGLESVILRVQAMHVSPLPVLESGPVGIIHRLFRRRAG